MNKIILSILATFTLLLLTSVAYAITPYNITQITNNTYNDYHPSINNNEDIVWFNNKNGYHVYLYDGSTETQVDSDTGHDPRINDQGSIVWHSTDRNVFFYNGSTATKLSSGIMADINENGYITWLTWGAGIFLYDGSTATKIADTDDITSYPQINNNGDVVWHKWGNVFLYDGTTTTQIGSGYFPDINDSGNVVWGSNYLNSASEIFLYNGSSATQITNNAYGDEFPRINNNGYVTWCTNYESNSAEIFLYDGSSIAQITNNGYKDYYPDINDKGDIVWQCMQDGDWEIYKASPVPEPSSFLLLGTGLIPFLRRKFLK